MGGARRVAALGPPLIADESAPFKHFPAFPRGPHSGRPKDWFLASERNLGWDCGNHLGAFLHHNAPCAKISWTQRIWRLMDQKIKRTFLEMLLCYYAAALWVNWSAPLPEESCAAYEKYTVNRVKGNMLPRGHPAKQHGRRRSAPLPARNDAAMLKAAHHRACAF